MKQVLYFIFLAVFSLRVIAEQELFFKDSHRFNGASLRVKIAGNLVGFSFVDCDENQLEIEDNDIFLSFFNVKNLISYISHHIIFTDQQLRQEMLDMFEITALSNFYAVDFLSGLAKVLQGFQCFEADMNQ